jgi:hypothetical protein
MGTCVYCKKPAGFLRRKHKECKKKFETGIQEIKLLVKSYPSNNIDIEELKSQIRRIAEDSYIDEVNLEKIIYESSKLAVEQAFEDGILTEQEEKRLLEIINLLNFDQEKLKSDPLYIKIVKGAIIRELLEGKIPQRLTIIGNLSFNLQKSEQPIWLFQNVKYYEMRTYTKYVGGYQGVSFRIAKGVYYKIGGFKGNPVLTNKITYIDTGMLLVTDKHIYFGGNLKSFRIKYDKIVSYRGYKDGIEIQRDSLTAKPQIFRVDDGWFITNLIANLTKLST